MRQSLFNQLKKYIGAIKDLDYISSHKTECPLTLIGLKCLSIISSSTIMAQKELVLDKSIFTRIMEILNEKHERVIYGEERINTLLFEIQN